MAKFRKTEAPKRKERRKRTEEERNKKISVHGKLMGRPPLPEGEKKVSIGQQISLHQQQWDNLNLLASTLGFLSRGGVNRGNPSWRTMVAMLADAAPEIAERFEKNPGAYIAVQLLPNVSIVVHPDPAKRVNAEERKIEKLLEEALNQ